MLLFSLSILQLCSNSCEIFMVNHARNPSVGILPLYSFLVSDLENIHQNVNRRRKPKNKAEIVKYFLHTLFKERFVKILYGASKWSLHFCFCNFWLPRCLEKWVCTFSNSPYCSESKNCVFLQGVQQRSLRFSFDYFSASSRSRIKVLDIFQQPCLRR